MGTTRLVRSPPGTIAAKDAARGRDEADDEGDEGAEHEPVGVAERGITAAVADVGARDTEEHHLDDPRDKGDEEREGRDEAHEDGAGTMIACAAKTEEERET